MNVWTLKDDIWRNRTSRNYILFPKKNEHVDFNSAYNHMDTDTRSILHVSGIQSRDTDKIQIIVISPDADVLYYYFRIVIILSRIH